jgi:hypothetical protein
MGEHRNKFYGEMELAKNDLDSVVTTERLTG